MEPFRCLKYQQGDGAMLVPVSKYAWQQRLLLLVLLHRSAEQLAAPFGDVFSKMLKGRFS